MIGISLWQPWASLYIAGVKGNETRHWPMTPRRGERTAIHAAKKLVRDVEPEVADICAEHFGSQWRSTLPRGCLIGSIAIVACIKVDQKFRDSLTTREYALGNYHGDDVNPDRYAWKGEAPQAWRPISYVGRQGFFTVPDAIAGAAEILEAA